MKKDLVKTVLFSLVVAGIALAAFFELKEFKEEEEVKEVKNRVVKFGTSEVNYIKLLPDGPVLIRSNSNWKVSKPFEDVTHQDQINEWLTKLLVLEGRSLGSDKDKDLIWSDFGFITDEKQKGVLYRSEKGEEVKVLVSDNEAFDGNAYLKVKEKGKTILYTSDPIWKSEVVKGEKELRSTSLFNWEELSAGSKPLQIVVSNKKEKEYYELNFKENSWASKRRKKWTIDAAALNSYFEDLKSYKYKSIKKEDTYKGKSELEIKIKLNTGEEISLNILKDKYVTYAKVSHRPGVVFRLDSKAQKNLYTPLLELKSKRDFYFFEEPKVKSMLIKKYDKSFRIKNESGVWVLKNKKDIPKNKEFNGAKVFEFFKALKELDGVRYVKANTKFYSSKRSLYLYNSKNNLYYRLEVGQKFPTVFGSRRMNGYLLRSSSSSQLLVVEAEKLNALFSVNYFKKKEIKKDKAAAK